MFIHNVFWFLLGAMATAAFFFIGAPLLSSARVRFGALRGTAIAAAAGLVAVTVGVLLYRHWGTPSAEEPGVDSAKMAPANPAAAGSAAAGSMEAVTAKLAARLQKNGGSAADWDLLAKSYAQLGNTTEAAIAQAKANELAGGAGAAAPMPVAAGAAQPTLTAAQLARLKQAEELRRKHEYAKAVALYKQAAADKGMNADAWADYADALASSRQGKLQGEPIQLIDRALQLDPRHAKALWLKASALTEAKQYAAAVPIWQQLTSIVPADSPDGKAVAANLAEARQQAGIGAASVTPAAAANTAGISGEIDIAPALRKQLASGMTLFVFAKSPDSPGPPFAVLRMTADRWPLPFSLDDSNAMMPGRNLSSTKSVRVEARLSQSGQALPQKGDLQGASAMLDPKSRPRIRLVIDQIVP